MKRQATICQFCDAGDPTNIEPYHTPDSCPSNQKRETAKYWNVNSQLAYRAAMRLSLAFDWDNYN